MKIVDCGQSGTMTVKAGEWKVWLLPQYGTARRLEFEHLSYHLALCRLDESSNLVQALLSILSFYTAAYVHRLNAITILV